MADLLINDRPIEEFDVNVLSPLPGWKDVPAQGDDGALVPGRAGRWPTAQGQTVDVRRLDVGLLWRGGTVAQRAPAARMLLKALQGRFDVRLGDDSSRYTIARLRQGRARGYTPEFLVAGIRFELSFTADDPWFYATTWTTVAVPVSTRVALPEWGSAPHGGVLRLTGAGTNPTTVIRRDRSGNEIGRLTLSTTWTSSEEVRIDLNLWRIRKFAGATETLFEDFIGSSEVPFGFDPTDGGTIEYTGAVSGLLVYQKADLV